MDIINKMVMHDNFGKGNIINLDGNIIEVEFEIGNKKFIFPDAFSSFLTILDKNVASDIERLIEERETERKRREIELERKRLQEEEKRKCRIEVEKFIKSNKIHPSSQAAFWCQEEDIEHVFKEWKVHTGFVKSGAKKGQPNRPARMHQNSACLLTYRNPEESEENRIILGIYMVNETFTGSNCDGYIHAHSKYRIRLTEEESNKMLFWNYYANKRYPHNTTWNSGVYRYLENVCVAQILRDIISLKENEEDKKEVAEFLEHFCKMNNIKIDQIPEPNGALKKVSTAEA